MLVCPECSATYPDAPDEPWRCECGSALEFGSIPVPEGAPPDYGDLDSQRGVWAFTDFLPVEPRVGLGEGFTPLVDAPDWETTFKLEYVSPTGSFKDRGAATTLSRALDLGVDRVVEDSSGNAGTAIATYAARAGIDAEVFVPADATGTKVAAIERAGAEVRRVEGSREDVAAACRERADDAGVWYASHAWNPAFYAGTATFAFELAAQRNWSVPDAVVLPVGHGTLLLGAYRGFRLLRTAGWIDDVPRLLCAQAKGYAPIVEALDGGDIAPDGTEGDNDLADGVHVREPVRKGGIVAAIEDTRGTAIAIGETRTQEELRRLGRAGFQVEPTCALAPAALRAYRESDMLDAMDEVVVPLTGTGLKYDGV